ncbi:uncharacterized protein LOC132713332 [Ruditapes philippinarum]|uniref:uncharacterized protein LOC132713332 n=1 Tax=Ruditapes philippinarum TaxID=129788 RepID=UPI00295BB6A4|nr:uncharacterized protein LOC132713332 [Ruditapes philippinarum]
MATLDNERYLRHIWLIGEGGLLLLRRIVMKEAGNNRQNLEALLLNHKAEFDNVLREQQQRIFPSQTTVNADVNTWDMSLLLLVLKKMFWHNLSPTDRSGIATIKYHRNHIQGHPLEMSMNASDYDTSRQLLEQSFRNLATGVNATAEIDNVIGRTASGNIDVQFALQTIRDMNEFKNSTVCALQESFERVRSEMSQMNDSIEDIKGHVENIGTVQTIQHDELMRSLNEEGQQLKQLLTEMKGEAKLNFVCV